jgi:D-cysteine desulfhydrase
MDLTRWPRRHYSQGPTPIQAMPRLARELDGPALFVKRDDLLGLAGGGNKTRKLEFVMAAAVGAGADCVITCGAVQSNACRLTLAAAIREGMACHLVLEERVENSYRLEASGNNLLYHLLGAASLTIVPGGADLDAAMAEVAGRLRGEGHTPYVIPLGMSNALGSLGYVNCADEILAQTADLGTRFDAVICASGSGGTHGGLLAGFHLNHSPTRVIGINVKSPKAVQEARVHAIANSVCALVEGSNHDPSIAEDAVVCFEEYVGRGYSLPTPGMLEAVELAAKLEGLLLDPVYTGKAMAGLVDLVRRGYFPADANVLFVHTGGVPALYAYTSTFFEHFANTSTFSRTKVDAGERKTSDPGAQ